MFSHKFVGALLTLASEVAIGELVAVKVLVGTTVRAIKDGEREAREASDVDFIGGKARGGANRVVVGVFDVEKKTIMSTPKTSTPETKIIMPASETSTPETKTISTPKPSISTPATSLSLTRFYMFSSEYFGKFEL